MKLTRTDQSTLSEWLWTVDHVVLMGVALLIGTGFVLVLAASPAVALKIDLASYHFVYRQLMYLVPSLFLLLAISALPAGAIRSLGYMLFGVSLFLVVATLFVGPEIKGARRWLPIGGFTLQPSEFLKPGFIIVAAALFSWRPQENKFLPTLLSFGLLIGVAALLVLQRDFGQTFLITAIWGTLFFLSGVPLVWVFGASLGGMIAGWVSYKNVDHVASRIDRFLHPESGDTYQIDTAMEAFRTGGFTGQGPGEGSVKRILPDAHSDFIFAVAAEEFGIFLCLVVVLIFAVIVMRSLLRAYETTDPFVQMAATGLATMFGLQAFINMAVNMSLLPAKGMTLPFVSYGGSSLLALSISMGMLLALTRRRASAQSKRRRSLQTSARGVLT